MVPDAEGMVCVRLPMLADDVVVGIAKIEGIAHLIPVEPGESWLVNNRIDLEIWNLVYG